MIGGLARTSGLRPAQGTGETRWLGLGSQFPPIPGTLANLVLFLQVQRGPRKSMSRGAGECLGVPRPATLCALGMGVHVGTPSGTATPHPHPSLTPPPCRALVGSKQLGAGEGVPRGCPDPAPAWSGRALGGGDVTLQLAQEHLQKSPW